MEIKLSLTEQLRPFKLSHFRCNHLLTQFSHSFQWIVFKPCIHLVNILKMCIWSFDEDEINIDRMIFF